MSDTATEQIGLAELLKLAIDDRLMDLNVAIPVRVESYDSGKQTVSVVPQLNRALPDGQGNYVTDPLPKVADVPVVFPRCQAFGITFPLVPGDYGQLLINQRNIGAWRATGNQGDPGDLGMHTLDGAVFLPGLYPDSLPAASADGSHMKVGSITSAAGRIVFSPTGMELGEGATKGVARRGDTASVIASFLDGNADLAAWIGSVSFATGVPSPGSLVDCIKITSGSANVKAED